MKKTVEQLFEGIECDISNVNCGAIIDHIGHDSRNISAEGHPLFFAIKGAHCDANSLIGDILSRNGNAIPVSEVAHEMGIRVADINLAMASVARRFYNFPDERMNIVAVTGTNGKSTIGFLLRHLLGKCGLLGTVEYDVGGQILDSANTTPIALDLYRLLDMCARNGCRSVALEASSHAIEQKRTFGLAVSVAIFTNLSHEHLDYHGTLGNYFAAKKKLFTGGNGALPKVSLVNVDDEYGLRLFNILKANGQRAYGFGFSQCADFRIASIRMSSLEGSGFTLEHGNRSYAFETKLFGDYNISNAAACMAAAKILGHDFEQLGPKLASYAGTPGRLDAVPLKTGAMAFVDYAHTPRALETVLSTLIKQPHGRIISVFGCGGERDRAKRAPMAEIVTKLSGYSIVTADNTRGEPLGQIFGDMRPGIVCAGDAVEFIADRRVAMERAVELSGRGDIVLIAGRGHENDLKIGGEVFHFNDREVLEEINAKL